jgi:hypothetical protein
VVEIQIEEKGMKLASKDPTNLRDNSVGKVTSIALAGGALLLGTLSLPALAGSSAPPGVVVSIETGWCGKTTFNVRNDNVITDDICKNSKDKGANPPALVVNAAGSDYTHVKSLCKYGYAKNDVYYTVGPFFTTPGTLVSAPIEFQWRFWGGPERDWDIPLWFGYPDWGSLVGDYIDAYGESWEIAGPTDPNPFTSWKSFSVKPCPIEARYCDDYWRQMGFTDEWQCESVAGGGGGW